MRRRRRRKRGGGKERGESERERRLPTTVLFHQLTVFPPGFHPAGHTERCQGGGGGRREGVQKEKSRKMRKSKNMWISFTPKRSV